MRKYYYYTYRYQRGIGHAVCSCDNGFFNVRERHEYLYNLNKKYCVITFWKEISREECEAMNDFFPENQFQLEHEILQKSGKCI